MALGVRESGNRLSPMYHPIVLYDDACGVCSHSVRFLLRHDRAGVFRFAPLASATGRRLLAEHGVDPVIDSVVVIDRGVASVRSGAVLAALRRLGGGWHLLRVLALIPRFLRDAAYDAVASRRAWFSRHLGLSCHVPNEREQGRFLA